VDSKDYLEVSSYRSRTCWRETFKLVEKVPTNLSGVELLLGPITLYQYLKVSLNRCMMSSMIYASRRVIFLTVIASPRPVLPTSYVCGLLDKIELVSIVSIRPTRNILALTSCSAEFTVNGKVVPSTKKLGQYYYSMQRSIKPKQIFGSLCKCWNRVIGPNTRVVGECNTGFCMSSGRIVAS
jgi:hypothetical protein